MTEDTKETRERLLEAATEVFGDAGYKAATVRRICRKAGANVAAVNYYFKDKQGLYEAVIENLLGDEFRSYPPAGGILPEMVPEEKLRIFIHNFLMRLTSRRGLSGFQTRGKLLLKEIMDPSPAIDRIVRKYMEPTREVLAGIVHELAGPDAETEAVMRCILSIIAQCVHYIFARPAIVRLADPSFFSEEGLKRHAAHITGFSLGGIATVCSFSNKDHIRAAALTDFTGCHFPKSQE